MQKFVLESRGTKLSHVELSETMHNWKLTVSARRTRIDKRDRGQYPVDRSASGNEDQDFSAEKRDCSTRAVQRNSFNRNSRKSFFPRNEEEARLATSRARAGTMRIDRFRKSRMRSTCDLQTSTVGKYKSSVTLTLDNAVMNIVIWSRLKQPQDGEMFVCPRRRLPISYFHGYSYGRDSPLQSDSRCKSRVDRFNQIFKNLRILRDSAVLGI